MANLHQNHLAGTQNHHHHITPLSIYIKTFAALIALTIITVITSYFDFGTWNVAVAMLIATVKAVLVILFFMQLKYDGMANKVTFSASFLFLGIFLCLTAADFVFRQTIEPMHIEKMTGGGGAETDPKKLNMANAALVAKGKDLFAAQCVACHGVDGHGNGPGAAALNPKPRNFHDGHWRFGGSPSKIFITLTKGSPGTAMGSFDTLSIEERYALAHYVRSIAEPTPAGDSSEDLKEAEDLTAASQGAKSIPIDYAMEQMEVPDQVVIPSGLKNPAHPGAMLYSKQCAQCHGMSGQGAEVTAIGVNPRTVVVTKSFAVGGRSWAQSESEFIKVTSQGIPGAMPGMAGYSAQEWSNLYSYVKGLTAQ